MKCKKIPVKTYFMEMVTPPDLEKFKYDDALFLKRFENPDIKFYKFLFSSVSKDYGWTSRLLMSDEELNKIINDGSVEIYVLYIRDKPAGFFELNRNIENEIKLEFFGLFPEYINKGIGKSFLNSMLKKAWSYNPKRVWLHTCEYDHPSAIHIYEKAGFKIYDERILDELYPEEFSKDMKK